MDIRFDKNSEVLVAEVGGRLDGNSASELETAISEFDSETNQDLICDLTGVSYVSSAGLRVILILAKRYQKRNSAFSLCGLDKNVKEVFQISGFYRIISIYANREEALAETSRA